MPRPKLKNPDTIFKKMNNGESLWFHLPAKVWKTLPIGFIDEAIQFGAIEVPIPSDKKMYNKPTYGVDHEKKPPNR